MGSKGRKVGLDFGYRGQKGGGKRQAQISRLWLAPPWFITRFSFVINPQGSQNFQDSVLGRSQAISPCSIRHIGTLGNLHESSLIGLKAFPKAPYFLKRRCATNETQTLTNPCHSVTLIHSVWTTTYVKPDFRAVTTHIGILWRWYSRFCTANKGVIKGPLLATSLTGFQGIFPTKETFHDLLIRGQETYTFRFESIFYVYNITLFNSQTS